MTLTAEHLAKMAEGRRQAAAKRKEAKKKLTQLERWEQRAIQAQGGEPESTKPSPQQADSPPPGPSHPYDFERMTLEEVRQWITEMRVRWDEAIQVLRVKEAQWSEAHNSIPCACGCGTMIDLSRGRFAASESYRDDQTQVIKTRYWATQRCVQAFRLAQSPQYKEQLRKEMEDKIADHYVRSDVLE